jgi:hypothetical protein
VLAAVIVAGLAAGAVITEAVHDFSGGAAPSPAAGPGRSGGSRLPVRRIGGAGPGRVLGPGGAAGPGGATGAGASMFVLGTVTAVSHTSITIGGPGHTITAAVVAATRITGKVTSIGGIKVGDQVSAQLTEKGGRVTAVAIAYPAQAPGSGSVP